MAFKNSTVFNFASTCTAFRPSTRHKTLKFVTASSLPLRFKMVDGVTQPVMSPNKIEILKSLEKWVEDNMLIHLKPVEKSWQPHDFLPNPAADIDTFLSQITELKERAKEIPDDYFILLVGQMINKIALPTYQTWLFNALGGALDEPGTYPKPWEIWARGWTAEEKRHGDLLSKYLYLSGQVNMKQVEKTVHYLIRAGKGSLGDRYNPYTTSIYGAFQERATYISYGKTANLIKDHGNFPLAQICDTIAEDEKRHEMAYTKLVAKIFEIDPNGIIIAFANLIWDDIPMPGCKMFDGHDDYLFLHFSCVAQRLGVYTAMDYTNILQHLIREWKVETLSGLSADGREAQHYVCDLPKLFRSVEESVHLKATKAPKVAFSWIYGRKA